MRISVITLYLLGLLIAVTTVSCEKVIDVDLNEKDPQFVIQGMIIGGQTTHRVRITRTLNFDEVQAYPVVGNASVTVIDNLGNAGVFTYIGDGTYELTGYEGMEDRTYTLTVAVDGKTFSASSTMPFQVPIDTLVSYPFPFGEDTIQTVIPFRFDPAEYANYYRMDIFVNDTVQEGIYLQDDQFDNGQESFNPVFGDFDHHDTVRVDFFCIDKPTWSYFNQLSINTGGGATPANPTPLFAGGALGFFSACTKETKEVIIP